GDRAVVRRSGAVIHDAEGRKVHRRMERIAIDSTRVEKAGYRHFMAKEIAEQPVVIADALARYLGPDDAIRLPEA
ncbi:hypothetical protein ACPC50_24030, partial [Bacillus subtilis]